MHLLKEEEEVSEANMVDTCKHFEIGSGSHLPVFVIEHL
jgi:hypothetical protein